MFVKILAEKQSNEPIMICNNAINTLLNTDNRSKKTSKLRVTGFCEGNSPVTGEFPTQRASNAGNVYIWWRHHLTRIGHSPVWILRVVLLSWPSGQVSVWSWATLARSLFQFWKMTMASVHPWYHCLWGQHGAHLGPTGPRWAPWWPYEPRYLGIVLAINFNTNMGK